MGSTRQSNSRRRGDAAKRETRIDAAHVASERLEPLASDAPAPVGAASEPVVAPAQTFVAERIGEAVSDAKPIIHSESANRVEPLANALEYSRGDDGRVEPEHFALAGDSHAVEAATDVALERQQLERQASQLSVILRRQRDELDHRESELNSRLAAMETEIRSARLWLSERIESLTDREKSLQEREAAIDARDRQCAEREMSLHHRSLELDARDQSVADRFSELAVAEAVSQKAIREAENDIARRQRELDSGEAAAVARQRELDEREVALANIAAELEFMSAQAGRSGDVDSGAADAREPSHADSADRACDETFRRRAQTLDEAEQLLAEQKSAVAEMRQQLDADREKFESEMQIERQRMAEEQRRARQELSEQRRLLIDRGAEIDSRRGAVQRVKNEAAKLQRESLETRLAIEELWARVQRKIPLAEATWAVSQIRTRLAEAHKLTLAETVDRQRELAEAAAALIERQEQIARRRDELKQWSETREVDLAERAAALALRERELAQLEATIQAKEARWSDERYGYQTEISRLLRQLRNPSMRDPDPRAPENHRSSRAA